MISTIRIKSMEFLSAHDNMVILHLINKIKYDNNAFSSLLCLICLLFFHPLSLLPLLLYYFDCEPILLVKCSTLLGLSFENAEIINDIHDDWYLCAIAFFFT